MFTQADANAIQAQIKRYIRATLASDWEGWGDTLAPMVSVSPANVTTIKGRDAAIAWVKTFPKIVGFTVDVEDVTGDGAVAYARGTYELQMILPDGSPLSDRGAFLQVHEQQADGTWPYTHLMFHSTESIAAVAGAGQA
jgi:ketosteroid isomerase-like protein